jgi:hypothetical protein
LAHLLRQRGQQDIVIFERSARVGGKSHSFEHLGLVHELGTCYTAANYVRILGWMREFGITLFNLRRSALVRPDRSVVDFRKYVHEDSKLKSAWQILVYTACWWAQRFRERTGWDRERFNRNAASSYEDWLLDRGLSSIFRFAVRAVAVMGYGGLSGVPAHTGLIWNTPGLIVAAAASNTSEPVQGWAALWERMSATMDVRLATTILSVRRSGSCYRIETDRGVEEVDHLVITSPLDECSWIELPDEVRALVRQIAWRDYVSTIVVAKGWFRDFDTYFFETAALSSTGAGLGRLLGARRTGDKVPGLPADRPDVYVTYQYADPAISDEQLLDNLKEDIAARGGTVTEVLIQKRWKYGPTLSREAILGGALQQRERVQGRDNLWFSGASFSHEAVVNIVDFNVRLARRISKAIKATG